SEARPQHRARPRTPVVDRRRLDLERRAALRATHLEPSRGHPTLVDLIGSLATGTLDLEHLAPKRSGIAWLCRGFCKRPCRAGRGHLAFLRSWLLSAWDAVLTAAWSMDDEGSDDTRPISATARSS